MVKNKRIRLLAELCKGYDTVLDIGTDHGLVLLEAFHNGYINKAIASDLRELPLKQAYKNLKNYPVTFVLSDGFLSVNDPFDLVIIAGMGSFLMTEILENAPKKHIRLILQPNDKYEELRSYLSDHGFHILDEYVLFEKHYYIIIVAEYGESKLSNEDIILGPKLKFKKEAMEYYAYKIRQIERIIHQVDSDRKQQLLYIKGIYKAGLERLMVQ